MIIVRCAARLGILAVCGCGAAPRPTAPAHGSMTGEDAELDHGHLSVAHDGTVVGDETFALRRRGDTVVITTHIDMRLLGEQVRGDGELVTDLTYRPLRGSSRHDIDGVRVEGELSGGPDHLSLHLTTNRVIDPGAPQIRDEPAPGPVDLYIDNSSFAHFAPLCARPPDAPDAITVFPAVRVPLETRLDGTLRVWRVAMGELDVELRCDGDHLVRVEVPALNVTATRTDAAAAHPEASADRTTP